MLTVVAEDNMNVQLRDVTATARDGGDDILSKVYVRGSTLSDPLTHSGHAEGELFDCAVGPLQLAFL